jgi:hypothetical protein
MLARRFTIVCLVCMIFGLFLSDIVAGASRTTYSGRSESPDRCIGDISARCALRIGG